VNLPNTAPGEKVEQSQAAPPTINRDYEQADLNFDPAQPESQPSTNGDRAPAAAPDPFDPSALRLCHNFADLGVRKELLTVPVRKPDRTWWFRVHGSDDYALQTAVIELKEEREMYLVAPALWHDLTIETTFSPHYLFTAINRQGVLFLWPVRSLRADGKLDSWSQSALEAAQKARSGWVRLTANMALGAYEVWETTTDLGEPDWPAKTFRELLALAFKGKLIDSLNHPVLQKLRGEI
jgi:hypothetical protein